MKSKTRSSIVSITGGKGGVGKTISSIHLSMITAKMGYKTLLIDGDMGLANVDIMLGIMPKYNIQDVIEQELSIEDIIIKDKSGLDIMPSGSGIQELTNLNYVKKLQLLDKIEDLDTKYDYIFIDTAAGISDNVMFFNGCSDRCIIVTTGEPHSLADAYASIKVLTTKFNKKDFYVIVNMVDSETEGDVIFSRLNGTVSKFLGFDLIHLGSIPKDPQLQKTVLSQSVGTMYFRTVAGQAYSRIVNRLFDDKLLVKKEVCGESYFGKIVGWKEL